MLFSWRNRLLCLVALITSLISTLPVEAQDGDSKPALIVSLASADKLLADIGYITKSAGAPELGGLASVMSAPYIEGVNTKKPMGAYINFEEGEPGGVVFVPVADFKKIKDVLKQYVGELQPAGGGMLKLELDREIFFKERGGWLFVSNSASQLANLPSDPSTALEGLHEQYDIAVRVNVPSIPEHLRDTAISEMKASFERRLLEQGADEEAREAQEEVGRNMLKSVTSLVEEADQLTVGWSIDKTAKSTYIDMTVTARSGTDLAQQMESIANTKSAFTGFSIDGAAANLNFSSVITPEDIEQSKAALGTLRQSALKEIDEGNDIANEAAKEAAKEAIGLLVDALEKTVEAGRVDGGASLVLNSGSARFIAGGFSADTESVEKAIRKLVEAAEEEPDFPGVEFDADKHGDIRFHTMKVPVSDEEAEARKIFGEELEVALGIGEEAVYLAFGQDSLPMLKKAIDASKDGDDKKVLPMQFTLSLLSVFEFASTIDSNPAISQIAKTFKDSKGRDHVNITARAVENGATYRLEVEEGVLKAVGQAVKSQQQNRR